MRLISTKNKNNTCSFQDALFNPMPSDGGLWIFEKIENILTPEVLVYTTCRSICKDF